MNVGQERRRSGRLSDEEFDSIVEAAARRAKELAKQELYIEIGKSVLSQVRWVLLAGLAVASAWLAAKGFIKP